MYPVMGFHDVNVSRGVVASPPAPSPPPFGGEPDDTFYGWSLSGGGASGGAADVGAAPRWRI